MSPSQLLDMLTAAIPARLSVLITGAPGIGKSDIVAQAAAQAGASLLISHPAVADPTDAKGLPWVSADHVSATFLPFGDLATAIHATTPTVWFLDDLGQAPPAVQASYMQLLLARKVNEHALPDCVTFVAATNRRTDRAGVSGILEPVKSRFATIVELTPTLDDWCAWAVRHRVDSMVVAFLRFRPDLLCQFVPTADLTNSPLPRTWAHVAKLLTLSLSPATSRGAVEGAVGAGAAAEFFAFLTIAQKMPDLDGIIANPEAWFIVPKAPAVLYAVVTGLAAKATADTLAPILVFAGRLHGKGHSEFAALLLRDISRREPALLSHPAFLKTLGGPLGTLIADA